MKTHNIVLFVLSSLVFVSCTHHRGTSIKLSESDHFYTMDAWFHDNRTADVEAYMNEKIGRRNNVSFTDTRIDGRLTLEDRTTFFIKKFSGHVEIKLDKGENSPGSYERIKLLCEGIKDVLN